MFLTKILLDFITSNDGVTQEYPLLQHLEKERPDFFEELGPCPSLYKRHFFLFYQLYRLHDELLEKNIRLIISPLEIRLLASALKESEKAVGETDALRGFYTNLENLYLSDQEVIDMQKKFWLKFLAIDQKAEALKLFGLANEEEVTLVKIKARYKELAQKHHPDKGGDSEFFIQLRNAFEQLKLLFK